jgi:GTP-binding protein EngB required for normal cell division
VKLDERLAALAEVVALGEGRLDVEAARGVVERAGARLGLGLETTIVALAGPTGAGKSTLFNALVGRDLAAASVRRPTTSSVRAAGDASPELLAWLRIKGSDPFSGGAPDLVLLDLPDYDSVETAHRDEVDRMVELVDLLVWVVDPQKYADSALHDGYLKRLGAYEGVMVLVLNQADRLSAPEVERLRGDLRRLLEHDGIPKVPVLALSATAGTGLPELRELLARRVRERKAAVQRLEADVAGAVEPLAATCAGKPGKADRTQLVHALSSAAGVPTVVAAVAASHRRKGALAAGWPLGRWLRRLRPDPLKRLRLEQGEEAHTSLPKATPVQRSQVSSAARMLALSAAGELAPPWPSLVRSAATRHEEAIPERLDRAVAGADLRLREPRWWRLAGLLQKLLALAAAAGALWLLGLVALGYLQLDDVLPTPELEGIPIPTLLFGGGLLAGLLLALIARWANGIGAGRRARVAGRSLAKRVEAVAEELVVTPVREELDARARLCEALSRSRR